MSGGHPNEVELQLREELGQLRRDLLAELQPILRNIQDVNEQILEHQKSYTGCLTALDQHAIPNYASKLHGCRDQAVRPKSLLSNGVPVAPALSNDRQFSSGNWDNQEVANGDVDASAPMDDAINTSSTALVDRFPSALQHPRDSCLRSDSALKMHSSASGVDSRPPGPVGRYSMHARVNGAFGDFSARDHTHLDEAPYTVESFYKETGYAQALARNDTFANVTIAVIAANAVYIGIDADRNTAKFILDANPAFIIMENVFCLVFTFEISIRFLAFRTKRDCMRDGWFKFDLFLVVLMVLETWLMPAFYVVMGGSGDGLPSGPLRLLRLLRLSRMARLLRVLPELVTMMKGIRMASRAVMSSLLMVLSMIYIFAIVLNMMMKDDPSVESYFSTLPRTMWTLFMDGTLLDGTGEVLSLLIYQNDFIPMLAAVVFLAFILLSSMTVMNMLIGVLCEVVSAVAASEKDEAAINIMKQVILVQLKKFDADGNNSISESELRQVVQDPESVAILESLQVDVQYLMELQQVLFHHQPEVPIASIMDLMLECRGDLPTTQKHMVRGQRFTRWSMASSMKDNTKVIQACVERAAQRAASKTAHDMLIETRSLLDKFWKASKSQCETCARQQEQQHTEQPQSHKRSLVGILSL